MSSINGYQLIDMVGIGTFSKVYQAKRLKDEAIVCLKIIDKNNYANETELRYLEREILIVKELSHQNIIETFSVIDDGQQILLEMEYLPNGTLLNYVNLREKIGEVEAKHLFRQMLSAIDYLHNHAHITHRDLKFENFMFTENYTMKLIDFGFSRHFDEKDPLMSTSCGSFNYVAPEIFLGEAYTQAIDMWSLGVILYGMIFGQLPFSGDQLSLINDIVTKEVEFSSLISEPLHDLLSRLLTKDPKKRITAEEALKHPWISSNIINRRYSVNMIKSLDLSGIQPRTRRNYSVHEKWHDSQRILSINGRTITKTPYRKRTHRNSQDFSIVQCAIQNLAESHRRLPPLILDAQQ
ncbi:CAMK family protein kinase [Tritrichomonas foetus]|uniref:CAMK family protein kinase n=1 Tax=Tritrichomonas foetus TaxID=1144522 RepID=A0A1J4KT94_9EUKA|nr:CAMK family protein kinase [Tritrichomonas foetus]|eukprot:OHT12709.1 CAMK family protein kinase [Tritrichomonas foetus]